MMDQNVILFTGGSGLLGEEMQRILPDAIYPESTAFDVTDYPAMDKYLGSFGGKIKVLVHMAAFTSPPKIDDDPSKAIEVNIVGTANVTMLCKKYGIRLIYISTDYVFNGEKGSYGEEDPVCPVNKYAWSKLGGEAAVRLYNNSLIIRCSFGPNKFPYDKAFIDQWTSRLKVSDFAARLKKIVLSSLTGTIHVGDSRMTVYEYARGLEPEKKIEKISIQQMSFSLPKDTSLDCSKFNSLFASSED